MAGRFDFAGRTVLVTGGSGGVGAALIERLLDRGAARILVWSRRTPTTSDGRVVHEPVDLTQMDAIDAALARLPDRYPDLSVVIANAGLAERALLGKDDPAELDRLAEAQIAVNLRAPVRIAQRLYPALAARGDGMIALNTSGLAIAPTVRNPVYSATKAGLRAFTQSMRYQAEDHAPGLRIVEILLPVVETPMTASVATRKMTVDRAADRIMAGFERGEREIWVGAAAILRRLHSLSPGLARLILRKATR